MDESGTVREEGACEDVKKAAEITVMSPPAHKLSHLRPTHDPVTLSSPDIIFDRSYSTRSSASELSPFRKFNISPPQLSMHRACGSTENAVKAWGLITCLRLRC